VTLAQQALTELREMLVRPEQKVTQVRQDLKEMLVQLEQRVMRVQLEQRVMRVQPELEETWGLKAIPVLQA
jgi:hypothetical protein